MNFLFLISSLFSWWLCFSLSNFRTIDFFISFSSFYFSQNDWFPLDIFLFVDSCLEDLELALLLTYKFFWKRMFDLFESTADCDKWRLCCWIFYRCSNPFDVLLHIYWLNLLFPMLFFIYSGSVLENSSFLFIFILGDALRIAFLNSLSTVSPF